MRWTCRAFLVLCAFCFSTHTLSPSPQSSDDKPDPNPGIQLILAISRSQFRLGEVPPRLKIELRNVSKDYFWAARELGPPVTNGPSYVEIDVTNQKGETLILESLDVYFSWVAPYEWWVCIAPSHYYGTEYGLDSDEGTSIHEPGTYMLTAKYVSHGGLIPANMEWHLPAYSAWKGEIKSNTVKVSILPPRKSN
jgi:hypothetical protein